MQAPWQVVLVPLDVTLENYFEEDDRLALAASDSELNRALADILDLYFDFYVAEYGRKLCALHDPLAAASLLQPDLVGWEPVRALIETEGRHTAGQMLVAAPTEAACATADIALTVDSERAEAFIVSRVAS